VTEDLACGIDEAGRGPVLGPLVVGAVAAAGAAQARLERLPLADSKALTAERRRSLDAEIRAVADVRLAVLDPATVDEATRRGGLNALETAAMAGLLRDLQPARAWVDGLTARPERFGRRLEALVLPHRVTIVSESKADARYPLVMAASIIAKVARDAAIDRLRAEHGEIGSGYPGDPATIAFLRRCARAGGWPPCVRTSWATLGRFAPPEAA
jgi:ribonuclease HII